MAPSVRGMTRTPLRRSGILSHPQGLNKRTLRESEARSHVLQSRMHLQGRALHDGTCSDCAHDTARVRGLRVISPL